MHKKGFTLIEMIIVIGVLAIALPAVFAIMFSIIREQAKVYALKQVKREGDFAFSAIQNTIRGYAKGVYKGDPTQPANEVCKDSSDSYPAHTVIYFGTNTITLPNTDNDWFEYSLDNQKVASSSGPTPKSVDLISGGDVKVKNLTFTCSRTSTFSTPLIGISMDLTYQKGNSPFLEDQAQLHYETQIKLKNY